MYEVPWWWSVWIEKMLANLWSVLHNKECAFVGYIELLLWKCTEEHIKKYVFVFLCTIIICALYNSAFSHQAQISQQLNGKSIPISCKDCPLWGGGGFSGARTRSYMSPCMYWRLSGIYHLHLQMRGGVVFTYGCFTTLLVAIVVIRVVPGQVSLRELRVSPVSIIPPCFTNSFVTDAI
jgi:hypothetical protein